MSTLTIISHTEHYKNRDGNIVGLGSTVTEVNHLLEVFDEIIHVAMLHDKIAPPSSLPYFSKKITFIALPVVGGKKISDKLAIIYNAPQIIKIIKKAIKQTDYFQFRAPTGIGVYVIPYLVLFTSNKGWFKYAGNWKQQNAPLAYSFQRWLLKKQKRKVTINGSWKNQPKQCLTFENPCLTNDELLKGQEINKVKKLNPKAIVFCFVGRLEKEKGLGLLINAFKDLSQAEKLKIKAVHIVGDGNAKQDYISQGLNCDINFVYHGFLSRNAVQSIYKEAHAIILPSASEGFPKVIAEAMNYRCLPIVSNVSSISNYVKSEHNGFLLENISLESLIHTIRRVINLPASTFSKMIQDQNKELLKFTFTYYNNRLKKDLLN